MFDAPTSTSTCTFATLHGTALDAQLFKRYGTPAAEAQDRTRWHLLLPLDQCEAMDIAQPAVDAAGYLQVDWVQEERVYTLDRLQAIAAATDELFQAQQAKGAPAKGLPVSYMHAIERRLQGEQLPDSAMERAGTIIGVHVCDSASGYPAGLYACVEWTTKAWDQIQDGTWHDLSIALATDYRKADGTPVAGECMFAAALVDVGFFEAIPSARNGLPLAAFDAPTSETLATYRRCMQRRLHKREAMHVKLRLDEPMVEQFRALITESMAPYADRLGALEAKLDALTELQKQDIAMDQQLHDELLAAADEEMAEEAAETAAATAPVTMAAAAAATAEAVAVRVASRVAPAAEAKLVEVVQQHVESGRLLPAQVRAYAMALASGDRAGAEAMLGDYTGLAMRSGSGMAAAVATRAAAPARVTASDLVDQLKSEGKLRAGTYAFSRELDARVLRAREAGQLV